MCTFYAQLKEGGRRGRRWIAIDFFSLMSFSFFIVKVSWKSFLNGSSVAPAMTLIIEVLIKPNKFQRRPNEKCTESFVCERV